METKSQVRRRHRAQRAELDQKQTDERGRRLAEVLSRHVPARSVVVAYMPVRGEPDVLPFLRAHLLRGGEVFAPAVVDSQSRRLHWVGWTETAELRRSDLLPVMEPVGDRFPTEELLQRSRGAPLVILVPALAVDVQGGRLGQGGGFYDTLFAEHPELTRRAALLGVVHAEEVLAASSFPVESHDLRLPRAATPEGMVELSIPNDDSV